jgi:peptidyl-prolyl cis-trans isomerase D
MFDFVRKHNKVMQFLLFLLIFPSFVLVGINGYNRFREKGDAVAKIDGQEILQGDWDAAHKQQVERIRQQMPTVDAKLLDSPVARYATLEQMVHDRVLSAAAANEKLTASDQRLARELQQNPVIASLRGPDGKLDVARYRQLVGAQGMSPEMFENNMRSELAARQVLAGAGGTAFATPSQASVALDAFFEKREVQVARFAATDYASRVTVSDADLDAYYKANTAAFQSPEQANIEYLVLDLDTVKKTIAVNEQELRAYFEQNQSRLVGQEERRASHILVGVPKGATPADKEKARAKANELLAAVKKAPDTFADVAKKSSDDPGSGANGGDLDFFSRGAMTKPFEDAVFAMKKGEITGPVESEFGFHIIKLVDVKVPKVKTFEDMKPELEADVKKQQATKKFAEAAEAFTDTVYSQPDSLKPAADKLKLEVRTAQAVKRVPAPGTPGALGNAKFLNALFGPDSVEKKHNTEAVEVAPNTLVSGHVMQYAPARTLPFAEVKDRVRERVVAQKAAELARKDGAEKLAAWKANVAGASLPAAVALSRQDTQKQPPQVVEAALRADGAALPALAGVDLGDQGYAIVKVNKVLPREQRPAAQVTQERQQMAQAWGAAENTAYFNLLKERLKVQVKVPKPAPDAQ